jgi:hypothetical protein
MKLAVFQQILELNQLFDRLIVGLNGLQFVPFFQRDLIQHARSDVELARVYANREFFDNFEKIVEDDARWEERRQRKGLPPRVVILPDWGMSNEDRFDGDQVRRRTRAAAKKRRTQPQSMGARR